MRTNKWKKSVKAALAMIAALSFQGGAAFAVSRGEVVLHETVRGADRMAPTDARVGVDNVELQQPLTLQTASGLAAAEDLGVARIELAQAGLAGAVRRIAGEQTGRFGSQTLRQVADKPGDAAKGDGLAARFGRWIGERVFAKSDDSLPVNALVATGDMRSALAPAYIIAPAKGSYEKQKLADAHEIAMRGTLGVQFMFDELVKQGKTPKYVMETTFGRQSFSTTGDDPERLGEAAQIVFGYDMVRQQSKEFLAAMIANGITRHFYALVYPESAEKTYVGWSVGLRTFIEAAAIRYSRREQWTNLDDYDRGFGYLFRHFQHWRNGANPDADVARQGPYFLNKIINQEGDPQVAVKDNRGRTTVYGRWQNEGGWWGNTGKTLQQAAGEAQQKFAGFIKKEFEWILAWKNRG